MHLSDTELYNVVIKGCCQMFLMLENNYIIQKFKKKIIIQLFDYFESYKQL